MWIQLVLLLLFFLLHIIDITRLEPHGLSLKIVLLFFFFCSYMHLTSVNIDTIKLHVRTRN